MNSNKKGGLLVVWLAAFLVYCSMQPYFVWKYAGILNWVVNMPLYIIFVLNYNGKNVKYFIFFALICILAAVVSNNSLFGIIFMGLLSTLFLSNTTFLWKVYEKFKTIYVVTIAISMVVMFLVMIGVSLPYTVIEPLNALKTHYYTAYPFCVIPSDSILNGARFCGLFDEPGVVGTTAAVLLFIEKFNLKKKSNVIILLSGVLSMSLFFYLYISVLYIYKFFTTQITMFKRLLYIIFAVLAIAFVFKNEITKELIVQRLEWNDEKQSISGNNRASDDLEDYVDSIKWTDAFLGGVKDVNIINAYSNSSSLLNVIIRYGFVVLTLYFLFYLSYAKQYIGLNLRYVFYMLTMFLIMYNRPDVFNLNN